ncbi:MAG: ABC transporter permease subunit [Streptosporangiales bacterium]|nr:ABC transporter permease subunit [Streptosporangiales bacterium]
MTSRDDEAASPPSAGGDATPEVTAGAVVAGPAAEVAPPGDGDPRAGSLQPPSWMAMGFLLPALLILGALVVYPIIYTVYRSFFDATGSGFVGLENYASMATDDDTLISVRNTAIWVVVGPSLVTAAGLLFAVLTERIGWSTAFKLIVFMPMAISFLASGVIFRLVYEQDPEKGVANAAIVAVHDTFSSASAYPGANPRKTDDTPVVQQGDAGPVQTKQAVPVGQQVMVPLVGIQDDELPPGAAAAKAAPAAPANGISGAVWLDFTQGGGGERGQPDASTEKGMPGMTVEAVKDGQVAAATTAGMDGTFTFQNLSAGSYTIRLPAENFAPRYAGADWLGQTLITPAIIVSYIWVWAGFAMVLIAAGLAAISREALEAARVDGATEWQVFRRVTMPLLAPVLVVVFVTLVINVLKIFDLVFIIGGGDPRASVLALQMWTESFGGGNNQGMGSAIAIVLFVLVLPAMISNIRRFRRENA